jgi:putative DNA primase/helicase
VAEGFATAATVHEATGSAVAFAFNANNLKPIAKALREKFPNLEMVICGDDDHQSKGNPV